MSKDLETLAREWDAARTRMRATVLFPGLPSHPFIVDTASPPIISEHVRQQQENYCRSVGLPSTSVVLDHTRQQYENQSRYLIGLPSANIHSWFPDEASIHVALPDDKPPSPDWAKDTDHKRVVDVLDSITQGKITKPARDALRKGLDKAEAPLTGIDKSNDALGRAIRWTK